MATVANTRKNASHSGIDVIVSRVASALIGCNERRVTHNALSRLSDRELEDIGLTRADIPKVVRKR